MVIPTPTGLHQRQQAAAADAVQPPPVVGEQRCVEQIALVPLSAPLGRLPE